MKKFLSSADGRHAPLEAEEKVATRAEPDASAQNVARALVPELDDLGSDLDSLPPIPRKGKPSKLTPKVSKTICDTIAAGNYLTVACRAASISLDTLSRWKKKGVAGEEPYVSFLEALQKAEDDWEVAAVKAIHAAGEKDWRAHLELLSRRRPERWSRERERAAFDDDGGANVGVGLNIILHLGGGEEELPKRDRTVEIEDHAKRERDIENANVLATAPIKDTL
jgi:hypothetical protein